jgi:choline kinase
VRGIILAAGRGRRLAGVLRDRPKCLLEFGETTLLGHQVAALAGAGIGEFIIVVGYEKEQIISHARTLPYRFRFVENPLFAETNTIYSLWLAREFFDRDFVYCNADVLFDYRIARQVVETYPESTLACAVGPCGEEEVKIILADGRITRIGKDLDIPRCFGEFIGVGKFVSGVNARFAQILSDCVKNRGLWNRFFEYAVDRLAGEAVLRCVDVSKMPAVEIDYPEDLERARAEVFPAMAARLSVEQ